MPPLAELLLVFRDRVWSQPQQCLSPETQWEQELFAFNASQGIGKTIRQDEALVKPWPQLQVTTGRVMVLCNMFFYSLFFFSERTETAWRSRKCTASFLTLGFWVG
jgi:hypothetical protein